MTTSSWILLGWLAASGVEIEVSQAEGVQPQPFPAGRVTREAVDRVDSTVAGKRDAEVHAAVARLASPSFRERNAASQWLWRQDMAVEAILREATHDPNPEVARRAARILDDFRFGIRPAVPPYRRLLLQQFREGGFDQRSRVLQQLLTDQQPDLAEELVRLESNRDAQRIWLGQLLQHPPFRTRFERPQAVADWVDAIASAQTPAWRATTTVQLLASPTLLEHFAAADPWTWLRDFISRPTPAAPTAELLRAFCGNETNLVFVIEQQRLPFLLELVGTQAAEETRSELLGAVFASSRAGTAIAKQQQIELLAQFARQQLGASARGSLLAGWFASPTIAGPLLEKRDWEGSITWLREESDAVARGQILGRFVASSKSRERLAKDQSWKQLATIAQQETDIRARHEYLDVILQHGLFHAMHVDNGLRELWRTVQQDRDITWRMTALTRLLTTQHIELLLAENADAEQLLSDLRRTEEPPTALIRSQFLAVFIQAYRLRQWMFERGHFDELLKLAVAEPELTRAPYLLRLLSDANAQEYLLRNHRAVELLDMLPDYRSPEARREYLAGLFANPWIMSALVDDGRFDPMLTQIHRETDPRAKAILFASFLLTPAIQTRYRDVDQLETLLDFARQQTEATARVEFLTRIIGNDAVLSSLLEHGRLDALLQIAQSEPREAQRQVLLTSCYAEPRILLKLVERGAAEEPLQWITAVRDDQLRRQSVQRLIYNPQVVESLVERGYFSRLLKLASTEPFASWRAAQVAQILRATASSQALDANENRLLLVNLLQNESDRVARDHLMLNLVNQVPVIRTLVQAGLFETLLQMAERAQPGNRERMLAQLFMAPPVLALLTRENRLDTIFLVAQRTSQDDARRAYWQLLYAQPTVLQTLVEAGMCERLLLNALEETDPAIRGDRLGRLLAVEPALRELANQNQLTWLFDELRAEASTRAQLTCLLHMQNSAGSLAVLDSHGRLPAWFEVCRPVAMTASGRPLALSLLNSPWTAPLLSKQEGGIDLLGLVLVSSSSREVRTVLEPWLQMPLMRLKLLDPDFAPLLSRTIEKRLSEADRQPVLAQLVLTADGRQWLARFGKPDWSSPP